MPSAEGARDFNFQDEAGRTETGLP